MAEPRGVYTRSGMNCDRKKLDRSLSGHDSWGDTLYEFIRTWHTILVFRRQLKHNWHAGRYPQGSVTGQVQGDSS